MKESSKLNKLDQSKLYAKNDNEVRQPTEQNRIQNEKLFQLGYKDLLRQEPFWLEGKKSEQLKPIMEKYLKDFSQAYGSFPAWYIEPKNTALNNLKEINLHNFKTEMKFIYNLGGKNKKI